MALSTEPNTTEAKLEHVVGQLKEPLYSPFIERYLLDELRQVRIDMAAQKNELVREVVDREMHAVDRAITYATDTVTYFFYVIAAASSVLVIVGWTSIRDVKERLHTYADNEINRIISEYETRLANIEAQLHRETVQIEENREEIEKAREVQSLWLRAAQDNNIVSRIGIYDEILNIRSDDCEALTYKADAVLELNEPQWAANLCRQALSIDPNNSHAFYQLACAYTTLGFFDDAVRCLKDALAQSESYRDDILSDLALKPLMDFAPFKELMNLEENSEHAS
ncbi:hypothetical protein GCM10007877_13110 [Marinibactrum halimedae]|uniref:Tetratricopeptide repeat protein n=2 Tax=Marinibactrum halimedae TaxID=1444977 RepID=A0AA37WP40_9GAMM|nr:hypothetical protein GCM10007877_13110 [Marinibactrum halimedae]